jgi:hypothetical protein
MRLLQEPPRPSPSDVKRRLQQPIDASELKPVEPLPFDIEIGGKTRHRVPVDADQELITTMDDQKLEFARLEYYERRALSRRKRAIRDFDARHSSARGPDYIYHTSK